MGLEVELLSHFVINIHVTKRQLTTECVMQFYSMVYM